MDPKYIINIQTAVSIKNKANLEVELENISNKIIDELLNTLNLDHEAIIISYKEQEKIEGGIHGH